MPASGLVVVLALTLSCLFGGIALKSREHPSQPGQKPRLVIWSWEHDDNLRFINPKVAAVAFYAGTITIGRETATLQKRRNFLRLNEKTVSFPVFRIELAHPDERISEIALATARETIVDYLKQHPSEEIQIDFDAGKRDRDSYLAFLQALKTELAPHTAISITALGSWCLYDKWLESAPVNETVAMMFSMGKESKETLAALTRTPLDSGARCAQSVGIALNERQTNSVLARQSSLARASRVYAFSPLGWTRSRYEEILAATGQQDIDAALNLQKTETDKIEVEQQ